MYRVGSVPYLNAKPLIHSFVKAGEESPVQVIQRVPSQLPTLVDSGECQAIMVSSIASLRQPGMRFADGVSISSQAEVESVRLFSRVPFENIRTLALDQSSMTSNALARILLAEGFDCRPECHPTPPNAEVSLTMFDACVLIGDEGMSQNPAGCEVLDLGQAWHDMTGLPFVWALWVGREGLTHDLSAHLNQARDKGVGLISEIVNGPGMPVSPERAENYLRHTIDFSFGPVHAAGLQLFGEKLSLHGLVEQVYQPEAVPGSHATV